jgi:hypothetical protein
MQEVASVMHIILRTSPREISADIAVPAGCAQPQAHQDMLWNAHMHVICNSASSPFPSCPLYPFWSVNFPVASPFSISSFLWF